MANWKRLRYCQHTDRGAAATINLVAHYQYMLSGEPQEAVKVLPGNRLQRLTIPGQPVECSSELGK